MSMIEQPSPHELLCMDVVRDAFSNEPAFRWWTQVCGMAELVDDIQDGEPLGRTDLALGLIRNVMMDWPLNAFYSQHRIVLTTVLVNCWSAWRWSNQAASPKIKAYDVATETACTILWLLGGQAAVDQHAPKIRDAFWQQCQEDDARDQGAK